MTLYDEETLTVYSINFHLAKREYIRHSSNVTDSDDTAGDSLSAGDPFRLTPVYSSIHLCTCHTDSRIDHQCFDDEVVKVVVSC